MLSHSLLQWKITSGGK